MTAVERVFCSVQSLAVGDPLAGSGAHSQRNLLISWPSGKWTRSLRRASDMSDALLERIEGVVAGGRRINLIHRQQQPAGGHRIYLMPENLELDVERDRLPEFLDAVMGGAPLASWNAREAPKPLILCCTHGKKDKCCAKFGNATYLSLKSAVAESGDNFEVWQSSHLGGCRLSASVMVFPSTRKYGRIGEADVRPLLDAETHCRPYLPCYRGRSTLTPLQQCAEVAGLQWLEQRGHIANVEVEHVGQHETEAVVTLRWKAETEIKPKSKQGRLVVTCRKSEVARFDTCADIGPEGPTMSAVWLARQIESLPGPVT